MLFAQETSLDKGIYKIEGNTAVEISPAPIKWELFALWFVPSRHYYVVGSGIYEKKLLLNNLWATKLLSVYYRLLNLRN